jgi:hypothetical protein
MRTFIKSLVAAGTAATTLLAAAAPNAGGVTLPKFRKGILATEHYQEIAGRPPKHFPEHLLDRPMGA